VAAYPPYNQHLVTDAGAGLLATGVAAALAAWWLRREVVAVLMGVYLAFALPHAVFHLVHPSDLLSGGADALSAGLILAGALGALVVLAASVVHPRREA
jgi:hypothetical protein